MLMNGFMTGSSADRRAPSRTGGCGAARLYRSDPGAETFPGGSCVTAYYIINLRVMPAGEPDRPWNSLGRDAMKALRSVLAALALGVLALAPAAQAQQKGTVGVSMPTKSSARWIDDGNNMVKVLKEKGYAVDLQYAEDDIPNQLAQIENMITKGVKALVIAAIDGTTLSDALQQAAGKGIKVIAYDRLIRNSPNVDYYATFDNFQVGVLQAGYIEKALGLKEGKGPFNIELFGGSPDDNNAFFFYNGAMSVLDPYIKSGKLVVRSGQLGMDKVSTLRWDGAVAQARMDNLLSAFYADKRVDAVLSPYDGLSIGILSSLKGVGYGSPRQPMPVVTGQDAEIPSIKSILAKEQTSTVFKDTRELAKVAANMVDAMLSGKPVEVNDTKTYENGVKVVPSYLLKPVSVDASNWKEVLIASGYYTENQVK
jgi:putative multiple sugar transport system substrate-binding protein